MQPPFGPNDISLNGVSPNGVSRNDVSPNGGSPIRVSPNGLTVSESPFQIRCKTYPAAELLRASLTVKPSEDSFDIFPSC